MCGGCDWQHAKPGAQRRLKGEVIAEQLLRLAGLTPEEAGWDGTVMPAEGDKLPRARCRPGAPASSTPSTPTAARGCGSTARTTSSRSTAA